MDLELAGKRAIVTADSSGIGAAVARQLVLEGADVGIVAKDSQRLDSVLRELEAATGHTIAGQACDITDDESVLQLLPRLVDTLGGIDILVNVDEPSRLAGHHRLAEIHSYALWAEVSCNVMSYLRCARQVAPLMVAQGWGRIINVSALPDRRSASVLSSAREASFATMTKSLAEELHPSGVNVTMVQTGFAGAGLLDKEPDGPGPEGLIGRHVTPDEVGYVVAFLASPKSVSIAGSSIGCGG